MKRAVGDAVVHSMCHGGIPIKSEDNHSPGSVYFSAICSLSPLQNQLPFAEVDFSLFVLELPLQNEKRKKSSSTIRFGSQIAKQKLEFTIHFEILSTQKEPNIIR